MSAPTPSRSIETNGSTGQSPSRGRRQERAGVVAGEAERRLGEVVRAEGEELGGLRDLVGGERAARDLDHRADEVAHLACRARRRPRPRRGARCAAWSSSSFRVPTSGIITSGSTFTPCSATSHGGLEDRARLHLGDLRVGDAEPAAAVAEHRVRLVRAPRCAPGSARPACRSRARARRCPPRRAAGTRAAAGRGCGSSPGAAAIASKIRGSPRAGAAGASRAPRARPRSVSATIISRIGPIFPSPKNMCSVRQRPMPCGAEGDRGRGLVGLVGVRADLEPPGLRRPRP